MTNAVYEPKQLNLIYSLFDERSEVILSNT